MKQSYQLILEETINKINKSDKVPTLLLHSCCAPCSSYVLEYLSNYFQITILYYNPNIYPEIEFTKRKLELENFISKLKVKYPVTLLPTIYNNEEYNIAVKGLENLGERSMRCYKCYELRMTEAAKFAHDNNFDYFTTVLSISPYKDSNWINEIGLKLQNFYNINYLQADFKKNNGYKRSIELSKKYSLYRQDYCGCIYSKIEQEKRVKI